MKKTTLLQKAINVPLKRKHEPYMDKEEQELFIAYARGIITITQVSTALGIPHGSVYMRAMRSLRNAIQSGLIELKVTK